MRKNISKILYRFYRIIREYYYAFSPDIKMFEKLKTVRSLTVEVTNACNASCVFCAYKDMTRRKEIINDIVYRKVIDSFVGLGGGDLSLSTVVGDPLLDLKFVEKVRYARQFDKIRKISTVTNCINLHEIGSEKIILSGINEICVSTSGFDPQAYKRIYGNDAFLNMKKNLIDLLKNNDRLGHPVKVNIGLRVDGSMEEVLESSSFSEVVKLADTVDVNYYYDDWGGRIKEKNLTGNMKIRPLLYPFMRKRVPCSMMYSGLGVLSNGVVTACPCRDLDGNSELVLGNIGELSLNEIYSSVRLEEIRTNWRKKGRIPCICKDCRHYNPYTYMMLKEVRDKIF